MTSSCKRHGARRPPADEVRNTVGSGRSRRPAGPLRGLPSVIRNRLRVCRHTTDVGDVGIGGAASFLDGSSFVARAGADIWGSADAFHFVYQPLAGDAEIVARVVNQQDTHQFAKAGLMMRETLDPSSMTVILDAKPDGGVEFMVRSNAGAPMMFIAGGSVALPNAWLRLQKSQNQVTAFTSANGTTWTEVGTVLMPVAASAGFVGLAVTSHDIDALNLATFDHVAVSPAVTTQNLLQRGGFEEYQPPALGLPGWLSDDVRQLAAKSESNQPHSGNQNGACWTTTFLDCGMFQTVEAPATGIYMLTFYATADRPGGLIGANVDGVLAATSNVEVRPFGNYGPAYTMTFSANRGQTIVVWIYSPAVPGYVVIDDVVLTALPSVAVTGGNWTTVPFQTAATFTLAGDDVQVTGRYDAGVIEAFLGCPCVAGQVIRLNSTYENPVPQTDVSFAAGSAVIHGTSYPFVEFGGSVTFNTGAVTLPGPDLGGEFPQLVSVSVPFTFAGELKGFEVLGLRDPRLVFDLPVSGHGTVTLDLLAAPSGSMQFYRIRYAFEP